MSTVEHTKTPILLSEQLARTAQDYPDNLALTHGEVSYTWSEVERLSQAWAKALLRGGLRRGDNIGLWLPNHPQWILLWLAATRIGVAVVPINTRYKAREATYLLRKAQVRVLFIERSFLGADYVERVSAIDDEWDGDGPALPDLRSVVVIGEPAEGMDAFDDFVARGVDVADAELSVAQNAVERQDTTIVVFTSGTTGNPKGVMHSHDALRMMRSVTEWMGVVSSDRVLGHLPLFHVAGAFSSFLPALISGGALVQIDQWSTEDALRLIERHQVSILSGIPTHFIDLIRHPRVGAHDLSSLRTGWIGGATVPSEVVRGARDVLGMDAVLPVYGMTETTSTTTMGRPSDPASSLMAGKGLPLGGYEVVVRDVGDGSAIPTGGEGQIFVRGYVVMKGYYGDPGATAEVLSQDGWFATGDLGVFDENGYLAITGRLSDKFIVGGNNVHPADIEHALLRHPAVKQAHVVAGPDDRLGEVAVAFVERVQGQECTAHELVTFCKENLAAFKVPRNLVFVEEWPMTPTGKVQRYMLREQAKQLRSGELTSDG